MEVAILCRHVFMVALNRQTAFWHYRLKQQHVCPMAAIGTSLCVLVNVGLSCWLKFKISLLDTTKIYTLHL